VNAEGLSLPIQTAQNPLQARQVITHKVEVEIPDGASLLAIDRLSFHDGLIIATGADWSTLSTERSWVPFAVFPHAIVPACQTQVCNK